MNADHGARWMFRFFISGKTPRNERSIDMLRKICDIHLKGNCTIDVIDILEDPYSGIEENILATPTLIKKLPEPVQRFIGDISNKEKLLLYLEILDDE